MTNVMVMQAHQNLGKTSHLGTCGVAIEMKHLFTDEASKTVRRVKQKFFDTFFRLRCCANRFGIAGQRSQTKLA